jgi:hypothetical protein
MPHAAYEVVSPRSTTVIAEFVGSEQASSL